VKKRLENRMKYRIEGVKSNSRRMQNIIRSYIENAGHAVQRAIISVERAKDNPFLVGTATYHFFNCRLQFP